MTTYKIKKLNKVKRNIKQTARILYELKIRGITQKDIANELGITPQSVFQSIHGLTTISRVDEWLEEKLGLVI